MYNIEKDGFDNLIVDVYKKSELAKINNYVDRKNMFLNNGESLSSKYMHDPSEFLQWFVNKYYKDKTFMNRITIYSGDVKGNKYIEHNSFSHPLIVYPRNVGSKKIIDDKNNIMKCLIFYHVPDKNTKIETFFKVGKNTMILSGMVLFMGYLNNGYKHYTSIIRLYHKGKFRYYYYNDMDMYEGIKELEMDEVKKNVKKVYLTFYYNKNIVMNKKVDIWKL